MDQNNEQYNPRWLAYVKAQGFGTLSEFVLCQDAKRYPGGKMAGFITWLNAKWAEWDKMRGTKEPVRTDAEHLAFNEWLLK